MKSSCSGIRKGSESSGLCVEKLHDGFVYLKFSKVLSGPNNEVTVKWSVLKCQKRIGSLLKILQDHYFGSTKIGTFSEFIIHSFYEPFTQICPNLGLS